MCLCIIICWEEADTILTTVFGHYEMCVELKQLVLIFYDCKFLYPQKADYNTMRAKTIVLFSDLGCTEAGCQYLDICPTQSHSSMPKLAADQINLVVISTARHHIFFKERVLTFVIF